MSIIKFDVESIKCYRDFDNAMYELFKYDDECSYKGGLYIAVNFLNALIKHLNQEIVLDTYFYKYAMEQLNNPRHPTTNEVLGLLSIITMTPMLIQGEDPESFYSRQSYVNIIKKICEIIDDDRTNYRIQLIFIHEVLLDFLYDLYDSYYTPIDRKYDFIIEYIEKGHYYDDELIKTKELMNNFGK